MKIAGGLTIILVFGALDALQALSTPLEQVGGGAGVAYDKKNGLTLEQTENQFTESHKRSEVEGNSHVTGSDGSETDSEFNKTHQEDKEDATKNTRQLSIGGKDGVLNYVQTKETSRTSQQTDEENSRIRQKQEDTRDGYYYNRQSKNEDKKKRVKKEAYETKESSGFQLGQDGLKKGKTESSEKLKTSETNERSRSNEELEEESIQEDDNSSSMKRSSDANREVKNTRSSEDSSEFCSDEEVKNDDAEAAGEDNNNGNNVDNPSNLRRKRHTIYKSENDNYRHSQEDHPTNYNSEQGHVSYKNEKHILPSNENYLAQENINKENHEFLGIQHGNENGVYHTNYGLDKSQLTYNKEDHISSTNEHYGAQENINRENHHYQGPQHRNGNGGVRNIHHANEFHHFSGNEHYGSDHGSYGFEEGHQYSPTFYNHEHESNNRNYNINNRNSNHYSVNSDSENYRHENHRSESGIHYSEKLAVKLRHAENANEYYVNRNYGAINGNYKESNLHSGNANLHSVSSGNGNSNDNYEHTNDKVLLTNLGKEYYRSNNGRSNNQYAFGSESNRSNRQGQTLKYYNSFENGNLGSRGKTYILGNKNYGSVPLRNDNSKIINSARNYLYGRRNDGNRQYRFGNRFNGNNAHTGIPHLVRLENSNQQVETTRYRQGVKHEDVRRFLGNNGRRIFNDYQKFNNDDHIRHYEPINTGYGTPSNGYLRRHEANNNRVIRHGVIDLHHFIDNTHYSTGNGRYVLIPGENGDNHRYYDTLTGLHFNIRKIRLHGGKNVIVPGNYVVHPGNNGRPLDDHDNPRQGLDLGFGIFYIGGRKYRHQDQIIPATKIEAYLNTLGISSIRLTSDGLPLGLSGGYFPFDLGSGLAYQGDGTYKYKDIIITHDKIIEFCKSKHINNISFTKDGFPADLFNGSLETHLKLPIDLGNELEFIGNGHYKCKDQIIPAIKIYEFIKEHNLDIEITKEGLPLILFNGTLAVNVGTTDDGNVDSKEDDLLNHHGIFPYDVGSNILYDGKGNYIYKNITIPRSNIIEFCKSHHLKNISFTYDGFPSSLFDDTEHGLNTKYPIYLGDDLYYIDNGHYKYKNQIILASDIGEFIKRNKINVHITKEGLPLGIYFGSLDNVFSPDERDDVGHESRPLNYHEGYPLDLGSKLSYLGNGSYIYDDKEIIDNKDVIKFCKSHSITNIRFTNDGFPADLFKNIEDDGSDSHSKYPIDLGDDLLYYDCAHYRHKNKIIPLGGIVEYIKKNKLNVSVTDYGLPLQLVAENFKSGFASYDNEVSDVHKKGLRDIYGDFPYDLGSNVYYLGNGSYRCDNEIIDSSDIINYCKSQHINDIVFTEDGFPVSLFNNTVSDKGTDRKFPINLGKGLRFLGHGHYDYENKIYPSSNIIDVVKNLDLKISLTVDGIPVELINEIDLSSSGNTAIDLGEGLFYDHGKYTYHNETIPADKIVEFSKSLNLNISFTKDGYPQLHNDEQTALLHENEERECPKGPIELGEEIVYIGDCHYMYQDHVIPAKYILELLDILHINDIQLPVGPDDDFIGKGDSNDIDSKDDHIQDLGFEVYSLGNGTYKYKNRYIPGECYTDFLKILGLKIQPGDSEKLVEDSPKSDRNEEDILSLIDELLNNIDSKTIEAQSTSANDDNTSDDTKNKNHSRYEQQWNDSGKSRKSSDEDSGSSLSNDSGYSTSSSTINSSSNVKDDRQLSTFDRSDTSSDISSDSSLGSDDNSSSSTNSSTQSNSISFVTSSDITIKDTSSSADSSGSSFRSDNSTVTSDTSDYSSDNSSTRRSRESSATITSSDSTSSNNTTTNYDRKTADKYSVNLSSIESKELSGKSSTESSSYDNSSDDSTTVYSSSTEYSDTSSTDDFTSNSNVSDTKTDDLSNTENNDVLKTSSEDLSSSDTRSSSSYDNSIISESSSDNPSSTEYNDSSSSTDTSYDSNDSSNTSEDSTDYSSTTENSNDNLNTSTDSSQDSSTSDYSSTSSYDSSTTLDISYED